jgi:uncharacterized protein involved in exopolysaccharide biosynthesis
MTLPQILRVLWARRSNIIFWSLLLLAVAAAVSLILPKTYKATAEIVIDLKDQAGLGNKGQTAHEAVAREVATQVDVIQSAQVTRRAVQLLNFNTDQARLEDWQDATDGKGSKIDWLADELGKDLTVRADIDGSVIRVGYESSDAEESALIANTVVDAYLNAASDLKIEPIRRNTELFDRRSKQAKEKLTLYKDEKSTYLTENKLIDPTGKYDFENEKLQGLQQEATLLEQKVADAAARQENKGSASSTSEVLNNPVVQSLRQSLTLAEAELSQMSRQFGSNHPTYRAQVKLVGTFRARLNAEIRRQSNATEKDGKIAVSQLKKVKAAIEKQRLQVIGLKKHRDKIEVMNQQIVQAEEEFDAIAKSRVDSSIQAASQTNASLLATASVPSKPDSPKLVLNTVIGGLLGALFGCILALGRESSRPQVRSVQDLIDGFDLPVLVSLPAGDAKAGSRGGGGGGGALPRLSHLGSSAPRLENAQS